MYVKYIKYTPNCSIHNQPLTQFCYTCSDVICDLCASKQPHSGMLHKVDTIANSFSRRVEYIKNYIENEVNPKRYQLMEHIDRVTQRIMDIELNSRVISKDLNVEVNAVYKRLENAYNQRILKIQTEIKRLSEYVNMIDDVYYSFEEGRKVPEKLLLMYRYFIKRIESIMAYEINSNIDTDLELPTEISGMEGRLQKLRELQKKSYFIDEVLYSVVYNYEDYVKLKKKEITYKNHAKIKKILDLREKMLKKCNITLKICYYCGYPFNYNTMNTNCVSNKSARYDRIAHCLEKPPDTHNGTKMHFWGNPSLEFRNRPEKGYANINAYKVQELSVRKLKLILAQIYSYLLLNETTLKKLFGEDTVTKLKFTYVMTSILKVSYVETEVLAERLKCEKGVDIGKLKYAIEDSQYMNKQFQKYMKEEKEKRQLFLYKGRSKFTYY